MTSRLQQIAGELVIRAERHDRVVVAIAGPPGSGKSTFAGLLLKRLERESPGGAVLVPMDGFHFDNSVLSARGLLPRKGARNTFDVAGLHHCLSRVAAREEEVAIPVFDRRLDLARAAGAIVAPEHRIVLAEGNYLLLDRPPWSQLVGFFDYSIFLTVRESDLRIRLVQRWLSYGLDPDAAAARADTNDLPNAREILQMSRNADAVISPEEFPPK